MSEPGSALGGPHRRRWRDVDGIVLLDKPPGMSSNQALQRVRRLLAAAKGGHAGTLDPMATGMLPLCFGQATKACGQLLGSRKAYRATIALGAATDTGDADGAITVEADVPTLDQSRVEAVLARFTGTIEQIPPMYSALKRDGRPLYELARRGEDVPRETRHVVIHRLSLASLAARELSIEVICAKGTYVRALGEDIARALGTCGHLSDLRRLWVEPFEGEPMVALEDVERWAAEGGAEPGRPPWLMPVDRAFAGLPRLDLDPTGARHLCQGRVLHSAAGTTAVGTARAYGADGRFLGLVSIDGSGVVRVARLFLAGEGSAGSLHA
ncbi:MAG TPA: tRNA pseudouridine(55) synthase TruB [Steroidobacteraceae bacterium]|nr:tRNA pseudouridine(55) synthase TruB [Steroidobacteraceae bacterium]